MQPESSLSVWRFYGLPEPSEGCCDSPNQDQSWNLALRGLLDSLFGHQPQGRCPGTASSLATPLAALWCDDQSLPPSRQAATVPGQLHLPVAGAAAHEPPAFNSQLTCPMRVQALCRPSGGSPTACPT